LEERFGEVPQTAKDAVAKITDLAILRQLRNSIKITTSIFRAENAKVAEVFYQFSASSATSARNNIVLFEVFILKQFLTANASP